MAVWDGLGGRGLFVAGSLLLPFGGCSASDGSGDGGADQWLCGSSFIDHSCRCENLRPGQRGSFEDHHERVGACGIAGSGVCCFVTESGSAPPRCECIGSQASCDAEAASRPGARTTESCPPGLPPPPPPVCATEGQNCRPSYLEQNGIEGCCEGTLCAVNTAGVSVCTAASPEDLALDRQCRRGGELEVLDPLMIEGSAVQFDNVAFAFVDSGPGGCVSEAQFTLDQGSPSSLCSLRFKAGPEGDANGMIVHDVSLFIDNCPESPFGDALSLLEASADSRLRFLGRSCEVQDGRYCFGGTFELRLLGQFRVLGTTDRQVPLTGAPLRLNGSTCAVLQNSECPGT
jgi:hypothetical protein